jgi:arylsulfatase A-like enzyme
MVLRTAGYETGYTGKWHIGNQQAAGTGPVKLAAAKRGAGS